MTRTSQPSLSEQALAAVNDNLTHSNIFMQYGSSAITSKVVGIDGIQAVIAVESNKALSDQLFETITNKDKLHLIYCNVGEVDGTGRPIDETHIKQFHQYMILPWALADKYSQMPDLILINGPFRVACFLYSLVCAKEGTRVLFNDFFANDAYGLVRDYATLESRHGDMAEFTVHKNFVMSELAAMIAKYSVVTE